MNEVKKASILSIGDELLIGQVVNTNATWMSSQLAENGIHVAQHLAVADGHEDIVAGLKLAGDGVDIVLATGGLGPTKDDITKVALAEYFDDELIFHADTFHRLEKIMNRYGRDVEDSQRLQCKLPAKATILPNDLGTAPAMYYHANGKHYFFMPGVPFEMKHLFADRVIPILKSQKLVSNHIHTRTILTAGFGESMLENKISDIVDTFPHGLDISYLPGKAQVRVRLTGNSVSSDIIESFAQQIEQRLGKYVFGHEKQTLEEVIGLQLTKLGLTLGLAESCTGGAISALITSVPGASNYFMGSIISYDNAIKQTRLLVSPDTIAKHGAVSEACVREMVSGALSELNVDVAVAISGIAGPSGGTDEKPVGTVFIGVGDRQVIKVKRLRASKSRSVNISYFTSYALNLLRLFLMEKE